MALQRPHYLRLAAASALVAAALTPLGCKDKEATAVVMVISSDLAPGTEITKLEIEVQRGGSLGHLDTYDVGSTIPTFPATLTLQADPDRDTPLSQRVDIRLMATTSFKKADGSPQTIERTASVTLAEQQTKTLFMNLGPGCLDFNLSSCGQQLVTCGNGGCVSNLYDAGLLPVYDEKNVLPVGGGACFDHTPSGCFKDARVFPAIRTTGTLNPKKEEGACEVAFDKIPSEEKSVILASPDKINLAVVWAATGERYTVIPREDFGGVREGWALKTVGNDIQVTLSEGLCAGIDTKAISYLVFSTGTCASKRAESLPYCKNPTIDSDWKQLKLLSAGPTNCKPGTVMFSPVCQACLGKLPEQDKCTTDPNCGSLLRCIIDCKLDKECRTACNEGCGIEAASKAAALAAAAAKSCPTECPQFVQQQ